MISSRIKAGFIHFLASLLIFSLFIFVLLFFWFPEPYFSATGGWQGLKIVAFIDLILGPLLTLIIFNSSKPRKELKADLSIILILQASALIWGINTVYHQRPIAITFWESSFYTIPYKEVSQKYSGSEKLKSIINKPREFYIVPKPIIVKNIIGLNDEVLREKLPPYQLIHRYKPIKQYFDKIKRRSININEFISKNPNMKRSLTRISQESNLKITELFYIPLISKYQNIILVFKDNGDIAGFLKSPFKAFF